MKALAARIFVFACCSLFAAPVRACEGASDAQPLYRDYSPGGTDHFYTTNATEAEVAIGYTHDGIRAYLFTTPVDGTVQFLRLWSASQSDHFYTTNQTEVDAFVSSGAYIIEDKTPMYIYPTQVCGSVPFYRLFAPGAAADHFYTWNATERDDAERTGWNYELIAGYVFATDVSTGTDGGGEATTTNDSTLTAKPGSTPSGSGTPSPASAPGSDPAPSAQVPVFSGPVLPASTSKLGGDTPTGTQESGTSPTSAAISLQGRAHTGLALVLTLFVASCIF